ncbi:MAG: hypothetical protein Kow00109_28920 [Acidobacteriota bacterium]
MGLRSFRLVVPPALLLGLAACSQGTQPAETESFQPSPQVREEVEVKTLEIGAPAPDFRLPGVDGKWYSLADFRDAKILVIIFTANHCPTAQAYEERIKAVVRDYGPRGVQVVAISPNSPLALLYEECGYTDLGDTYEEMQIRARDHGFNFPYLYDGDTQEVSLRYGPVATPHAFVFDGERKLRYVGRLDGSEKPGTGNAEDLRAALDALLDGREVPVPVTKAFGCSIKWSWKASWREKVNKEWSELPVTLETIDAQGIRELLANDSEKLLLINVWATWCGPCVIEFPELVKIHRMYKGRKFELVTISADSPEQEGEVLRFLQEQHAAVRNYLFSSDDQYALIEAIDPEWNGSLPHTLLVEPGGKIVYRHTGLIEPLELKRTIVEHPLIGRYY